MGINGPPSHTTRMSWDEETPVQSLFLWTWLWCLPLLPGLISLSRFLIPSLSLKYPGIQCTFAACQGPQEASENG